jgi:transposase
MGLNELEHPATAAPPERLRREGGGRKNLKEKDPDLMPTLRELLEPDTRGDPESPLQWVTQGTATLAGTLTEKGHPVSDRTVSHLLRKEGFSLQANRKDRRRGSSP